MEQEMQEVHRGQESGAEMERAFRSAMRVTAASVSLLTCRSVDGNYQGMAVTSASSLSMDPPSMIVAVNRAASSYCTIRDTGMFCLNLLSQEQIGLVDSFCRSENRATRFHSPEWCSGPSGLPYLESSLASIFCHVEAVHDYATHAVFFGTVYHTICDPLDERMPLIWLHGGPLRRVNSEETCQ